MVKVLTKIRYHVKSGFRHGFKNVIFSKFFFGFIASIGVLLSSHDKAGRIRDNLNARINDQEDTFDFIIVGAGTAGCLLANRLSEQHKVLLLEAGGEPHPLQRIPGMAFFMLNYRETDWMHRTVPQRRACFSSPGRRAGWCAGRNLGGTSNLDYLVHMRGSPRDYDNWAKITGDDSWSYEALLHYFRKHENYQGDSPDREAHGFDGDMMLETPSYTGMAKEFIRAGQELGYEHVDLNARFEEGFDSIYSPMEMGERKASFHAFLEPVRDRETLTVRKYSRVTKVLVRSFDNTAFGVEYNRHGSQKSAYATKEVILTAGAVESPKLLMLSGIGPRTHLADLGIPVIADLPVGKNLQDHLAVILGPFFIDPARSFLIERDITLKSFYEYKSDGNGPLSTSIFHGAAMISSKSAKHSGIWNWPDILLLLSGLAGHKTFARDMAHAFNLNQKLIKKYYHHALGRDSFMIFVSAARPQGRGDISLEKNDPDAPPAINPHYLENESDMQITLEGIKTALYLVENTTSFTNLRARFTSKKFPGCDHMPFRSDAYWECYTRHFSVSLNDGAGTCAMGNPHLNLFGEGNGWGKHLPGGGGHFMGAVVDPKLMVIGINHLRVADSSVMPQITGGQTAAATMMIAEKCADIVNEAWTQNENGPPPTTLKPGGWSEPSQQYGPPPGQQYGPPPVPQYGPPQQVTPPGQQYGAPSQNYGAPPPPQSNYGAPPPQQYGPPKTPDSSYGAPPQQAYGPPPETSYGSPEQTEMTPPMEGGYGYTSQMTTSEQPTEAMMQPPSEGESQQMSEMGVNTMPTEEEETTTMTTTTTTMSTTTGTTTMETPPPMVVYGPPADSASETTTQVPSEAYGPPGFIAGSAFDGNGYNGWSGGGFLDTQYGVPGPRNEPPASSSTTTSTTFDNMPGNSPPPYLVPPGLPGEDTTTMASTTSGVSVEFTPPPGDRAEPPYNPQLGNPIFGGGQDPRNLPAAGNTDTSSTTASSGGKDPPEENAPSGGSFHSVYTDSATSESSAVESSTFKSYFSSGDTSGSTGIGVTAAARPNDGIDFLEHDTKLRPGIQISNPFPDIYYATQENNEVPESFFKKYPLSSSVEFGNKIPNPPHIVGANGPLFFRNPEFTTRRPIVFGDLAKKEATTRRMDVTTIAPLHPLNRRNKTSIQISNRVQNRLASSAPPYVPYYDDKNRRPDEGTVKPTIIYKSIGVTNKIPSTATVPNIYYSVKDKVSKEGVLEGPPVLFAPTGPPPTSLPSLSTTSEPPPGMIMSGTSGPSSVGFGGSAASSNNYWTNASPRPLAFDGQNPGNNFIQVEVSGGKDSDSSYWTNASPKPPLPMPRLIENTIQVDSDDDRNLFLPSGLKRPGRIHGLHRKPTEKPEPEEPEDTSGMTTSTEKSRRIVRIKSDMIWTTTQRPDNYGLTTTGSPDPDKKEEGAIGKLKIRVKTKEVSLRPDEAKPLITWRNASYPRVKSTTTAKPEVAISGTSTPTTSAYFRQQSQVSSSTEPVTVTPRPLLSVQVWNKDTVKPKESTMDSHHGSYFQSHPDFEGTDIHSSNSWKAMHSSGGGVGSVLPADDQDSSDTLLLSNLANAMSNLGKRLRGRPPPPPPPPRPPPPDYHYGTSTARPFIQGNGAFSGNSATRFMLTQVPDLFQQDDEEGPYTTRQQGSRGLQSTTEHSIVDNSLENRKKFTDGDSLYHQDNHHHHHGPTGHQNNFNSHESSHYNNHHHQGHSAPSTGPSGGHHDNNHHHHGPSGGHLDNHHLHHGHSGHSGELHNNHHHHGHSAPSAGPTGRHHNQHHHGHSAPSTGPSGHHNNAHHQHDNLHVNNHIPPPHTFDSGERNRFNLFEGNGALPPPISSPASPSGPPPPPPHAHPHPHDNHHHHNHLGENNFNYPNPTSPPANRHHHHPPQDLQVTTPVNDFTSPAYDENPLQFFRDATPNLPDRFQVGGPTSRPVGNFNGEHNSHHPHSGPGAGHHQPQFPNQNDIPGLHPPQHPPPQPSGPGPTHVPNFVDSLSSLEFGNQFLGGSAGSGGSNFRQPQPSPSAPPPPPPPQQLNFRDPLPIPQLPDFRQVNTPAPTAFGLGHSAPVGMGGDNSPPPAKGLGFNNNVPPHQHPAQPHHHPQQNFDPSQLPPRFGGPGPSPTGPPIIPDSPPLPHLSPEDLGQIPDIFGFRNVLPSTSAPPRDSGESPRFPAQPSQPPYQDFNLPQYDFASPPTTALQQSVHNILTGPEVNQAGGFPDDPHRDHRLREPAHPSGPPLSGSASDIPKYLGEPKVYQDGVDADKVSLTYDDTGANGYLDPPVIMGENNKNKPRKNVDITQVSLTHQNNPHASAPPPQGLPHQHGIPPTGPHSFPDSQNNDDVTQTREQILSNFGPQKDPEDQSGDLRSPRPRRPNKRPFGSHVKNGHREKHRNPYPEFGDPNFFQDNPFAELLNPRPAPVTPTPFHQQSTARPQQEVFSVTPFEQPDFTRFEVQSDRGQFQGQQPSTVAPPVVEQGRHKMKEYTIYSNPDEVDITVDHHGRGGGVGSVQSVPAHDHLVQHSHHHGGHRSDHLRRRSDSSGGPPRRKKRRRHPQKGPRGGGGRMRGGRAIKLRPLWGGEGRTPMKGRRRLYMVKAGDNTTLNYTKRTTTSTSTSTETPLPEEAFISEETLLKRSMKRNHQDEDMAALSQELLKSFLGLSLGRGAHEGDHDQAEILEQMMRNTSTSGRGGMSMEEDTSSGGLEVEENFMRLYSFTSTTTTSSTPPETSTTTSVVTSVSSATTPQSTEGSSQSATPPTEWTPVEAFTTNATILEMDYSGGGTSDSSMMMSSSMSQEVVTLHPNIEDLLTTSISSSPTRSVTSKVTRKDKKNDNKRKRDVG